MQNIKTLFWLWIDFKGKLKSDYFEIRRPFSDNLQENYENIQESVFLFMSEDRLNIKCTRPCWFLGAGFHGPYSQDQTSIKNLKVEIHKKNKIRFIFYFTHFSKNWKI